MKKKLAIIICLTAMMAAGASSSYIPSASAEVAPAALTPSCSGSRILYYGNDPDVPFMPGEGAYLVDPGGTTNTRLNADAPGYILRAWDISSDGVWILFSTFEPFGAGNKLFKVRQDGTGLTSFDLNINPDQYLAPEYVAFSPDGGKIAFSARSVAGSYQNDIFIMNSDGTNLTNLSGFVNEDEEKYHQPRFSPDGTKLLFHKLASYDVTDGLYTINTDGSGFMPIFLVRDVEHGDLATDARYSSDGTKIYFLLSYRDVDGISIPQSIHVLVNGFPFPFTTTLHNVRSFDVSADDSKIVFESYGEIYSMDSNGENHVNLTNAGSEDLKPIFNHDGTKIAFSSDRDGDGNFNKVHVMNSDVPECPNLCHITTSTPTP